MKTTKEMIEVMQAYEDGKEIEYYSNLIGGWVLFVGTPSWSWDKSDYRIKPEPKEPTYRPYESVAEMLCDYKRRVCKINNQPKNTMPLIWLKYIEHDEIKRLVIGFDMNDNQVLLNIWCDMSYLYRNYQYLDGTPCGRLVEE